MTLISTLLMFLLTADQPSVHPEPAEVAFEDAAGTSAPSATGAEDAALRPAPSIGKHRGPSARFVNKGDLFLNGASAAGLGGTHTSSGGASVNTFDLSLQLGMGYFVSKHIAIGGEFAFAVDAGGGSTQVGLALGPVLTGRIRVNDRSAFLPSFGLLYGMNYYSSASLTTNQVLLDINLPFAFSLVPGVLVTFGPYVQPGFGSGSAPGGSSSATSVSYGVRAGLLGWR